MKDVFNLTNKYIILASPLILYSLISNIYLVVSANSGRIINILFAIILFTLMTAAFVAGWFNMIKQAILEPESENPNLLMKEFTGGVGDYFLSSIGCIFLISVVSIIMLVISYFIGMNLIGDVGISAESFAKAFQDSTTLKTFVNSLSLTQLQKLSLWNLLILGSMTLTYFLFILYLPAIFFKNKNPFIAFFISIKDLFNKKFPQTLGIFLLISFANVLISTLATVFSGNIITHFLITFLNFYFVTAVGVGIFYYYYHNFVKTMIGQNLDIKI